MKVKDLIANLKRENQESDVYVQDKNLLLDVFEVTGGKNPDESSFVVIVPDMDEE